MMTTDVKELNIDDLPCKAFQQRIDDWKRYGKSAWMPKVERLVSHYNTQGIGFAPETLLHGWRGLEKRTRQLEKVVLNISAAYWNALKEASAVGKVAGGSGDVWIPQKDPRYVDVFDCKLEVQSNRSHDALMQECISSPNRTAHILVGNDLARMHRLKERENTWRRRYWTYNAAFITSVEARLREFIESQVEHHPGVGRIKPACAFLFSNENRRYLVTISQERYEFIWFGGTLFHDGLSTP